jgi:hypothetical protein
VGAGEALAAGTTASSYGGRHRIIPDRNCFAAIVFMARTSTPRGCYLPVLDRLMPVDNLTWFVNDPGRDSSRR